MSNAFSKDLSIPSLYKKMDNTIGNLKYRVIDHVYHALTDDQKENLSDETVNVLKKLSVFFEYDKSSNNAFIHNRECLKIAVILFAKNKKDDYFYTIETFESNALRLHDSFVMEYKENEMNRKLMQEQQQQQQQEKERKLMEEKLTVLGRAYQTDIETRKDLSILILAWKTDPHATTIMLYKYSGSFLIDVILENIEEKQQQKELIAKLIVECDLLINYLEVQKKFRYIRAGDIIEVDHWALAELAHLREIKRVMQQKSVV
jgi:hypothetical protein